MKETMGVVSIHEASGSEIPELHEFVLGLVELGRTDPYLASFRHGLSEGHSPEERFIEYAVRVDGELAARCEVNLRPQSDDIVAYGPGAALLYADERVATLAGDLVAPAFRGLGLHSAMIEHRLRLLSELGYTYAMCGIIVGNEVSRRNYGRMGFEIIGEKCIDWGDNAVGDRVTKVALCGFRLS